MSGQSFSNIRGTNFELPENVVYNSEYGVIDFYHLIENHIYKIKLKDEEDRPASRPMYGVFRDIQRDYRDMFGNVGDCLRFYSFIGYPNSKPVPIHEQITSRYNMISFDSIDIIWDTNIHYVMRGEMTVYTNRGTGHSFKSTGMIRFDSDPIWDNNHRDIIGSDYFIDFETGSDRDKYRVYLEDINWVDTATPHQKIVYPLNQIGVQLPADNVLDLVEYMGKTPGTSGGNKTRRQRKKRRRQQKSKALFKRRKQT